MATPRTVDAEALVSALAVEVGRDMKALRERVAQLEAQLAARKGLAFRGTWQAPQAYEPGDMTTHKGGLWHCNTPTRAEPGTSKAWTLAVKKGDAT